jgi:hypothetical protein
MVPSLTTVSANSHEALSVSVPSIVMRLENSELESSTSVLPARSRIHASPETPWSKNFAVTLLLGPPICSAAVPPPSAVSETSYVPGATMHNVSSAVIGVAGDHLVLSSITPETPDFQ